MSKLRRFMAVALSATMVLGSSFVSFAEEATSGSSVGAGENEGHVDKHVISVTLPTVETGSTPFNYTIDPERLVSATSAAAYTGKTFTDDAKANGVYFATSDTAYDTKSTALKVVSESSADIELTVKVDIANDGNVELVETAPDLTGDVDYEATPELYLVLMVGETETVLKGDSVSKTVTVEGEDSNFEIQYNDDKYEYGVADGVGADDWNSETFYLTGIAGKTSAEDATAPTLTVTWSWTDPEAAPADAAPSVAKTTYTKDELVALIDGDGATITVDFGAGTLAATEITSVTFSADGTTYKDFSADKAPTINENSVTFKATWINGLSANRYLKITLDNGDPIVITVTV